MDKSKYKISPKPSSAQIEAEKRKIVGRFYQSAFGRRLRQQSSHDGKAGHNAETLMGLRHNSSNSPDFGLIELKTEMGGSRITFGDWSPDYKIWKSQSHNISRDEFMKIFGKYNEEESRWSWSGTPVPKINLHNAYGQTMKVESDLSIVIQYSYSQDQRPDKADAVPPHLQKENLTLARWSSFRLRSLVENKFNLGGWCKLKADKDGVCNAIVFGRPFTYEEWIGWVKSGNVFFDSGMHQGNARPYSHWRAENSHWDSLVTESYDHHHESEFNTVSLSDREEDVHPPPLEYERARATESLGTKIGEMPELLGCSEKTREATLSTFAKLIMERIPRSVWGNMREDEIKASIHANLAGYSHRGIELESFPFHGSLEEKEQWRKFVPPSLMFRGQCKPYGLHESSDSLVMVSEILEAESIRDGSRGSRRETASVIVSLEGKPWDYALRCLSRSIGCHDSSLLAKALILFEVPDEGKLPKDFEVRSPDQMERLLGALAFVAGSGYERLIPSSDLVSAIGGIHHLQDWATKATVAVIESADHAVIGEIISKNDLLAGIPVALGVGNVCDPYPVGGSDEDRNIWREKIKNDPRVELVLPWTSDTGRVSISVSKASVLTATTALDKLWQDGGFSVKSALEPYSIAVQAQIAPQKDPAPPSSPSMLNLPSHLRTEPSSSQSLRHEIML